MAKLRFTSPEGRTVEVDSPDGSIPSEQELDQIFASDNGFPVSTNIQAVVQNKQNGMAPPEANSLDFDNQDFFQPESEDFIPQQMPVHRENSFHLNPFQEIMLGLTPNDEIGINYLTKQLQGKHVSTNGRDILVDGMPINPKGFDLGDITRNAGYIFPFAGQVIGGLMGIGAGTVAGAPTGPGAFATAAVGGIRGATIGSSIGEGLRLATGKLLNLDSDGEAVFNSMADNAKATIFSEILGLGVVHGGGAVLNKVGKTAFVKGISDIYQKSIAKLKDLAPDALHFLGGIETNAIKIATQENRPSQVLNSKYFDPEAINKIITQTLFGDANMPLLKLERMNPVTGFTHGSEMIAKSIGDLKNPAYNSLIKNLDNRITDETIETIANNPINKIINKANADVSGYLPAFLAKKSIDTIDMYKEKLGSEVDKAIMRSTKDKFGTPHFLFDDITKSIQNILGTTGITKGVTEAGFVKKSYPKIAGIDELMNIRNLFRGVEKQAGKEKFFSSIPKKDAVHLREQFEAMTESVLNRETVPRQVKEAVIKIKDSFRKSFYDQFNSLPEVKAFKEFSDLTDNVSLQGFNSQERIQNLVKNFGKANEAELSRDAFSRVLKAIPDGKGAAILDDIRLYAAGRNISEIDPVSLITKMNGPLSSKQLIDPTSNSSMESLLRSVDQAMSQSPKMSNRLFINEARKAVAAKGFLGGSPNVMRVATVAGITGIASALATLGMGFVGGIGGAAASIILTKPENIAKMLVSADKRLIGSQTKNITKGLVDSKKAQAIFSALLKTQMTDPNDNSMFNSTAEAATLGQKNNNPVNLKALDKWDGMIGKDKYEHAIFKDLDHGIRANYKNFSNHRRDNPDQTLNQYFNKFAEENGTEEANFIAKKLGISPNTKLKNISTEDILIHAAQFESETKLDKKKISEIKKRFNLP